MVAHHALIFSTWMLLPVIAERAAEFLRICPPPSNWLPGMQSLPSHMGMLEGAAAVPGCPFQGSPSILMQFSGILRGSGLLVGDFPVSFCVFLAMQMVLQHSFALWQLLRDCRVFQVTWEGSWAGLGSAAPAVEQSESRSNDAPCICLPPGASESKNLAVLAKGRCKQLPLVCKRGVRWASATA